MPFLRKDGEYVTSSIHFETAYQMKKIVVTALNALQFVQCVQQHFSSNKEGNNRMKYEGVKCRLVGGTENNIGSTEYP